MSSAWAPTRWTMSTASPSSRSLTARHPSCGSRTTRSRPAARRPLRCAPARRWGCERGTWVRQATTTAAARRRVCWAASTQFEKRGFRLFGEGLKIGNMLSQQPRDILSCSCRDAATRLWAGRLEGCSSGESQGVGEHVAQQKAQRLGQLLVEEQAHGFRPPGFPTSGARARPRTPSKRGSPPASIAGTL